MDLKQLIFMQYKKSLPISGGDGDHWSDPIVLHNSAAFLDYEALESEILQYLGELFYFRYQITHRTLQELDQRTIKRVYLDCICKFTFNHFNATYSFDITEL